MVGDKIDEQTRDNFISDWLPVSSAVCRLGSDRTSDKDMKFDYPRKTFPETFYGIIFFPKRPGSRAIKSHLDIITLKQNCNFYVIDISNRKDHIAAQSIFVEHRYYETGAVTVLDYEAFALVLINRLVGNNSDRRRMFGLI